MGLSLSGCEIIAPIAKSEASVSITIGWSGESCQDWCCCKCYLECVEGCVAFVVPAEQYILAKQPTDWGSDFGVGLDKTSVEIRKSKEGLHILDGLWCWPVEYCFNLLFVHLDSLPVDDIAKEFH